MAKPNKRGQEQALSKSRRTPTARPPENGGRERDKGLQSREGVSGTSLEAHADRATSEVSLSIFPW